MRVVDVAAGIAISTLPTTPSAFWTCGTVHTLCEMHRSLLRRDVAWTSHARRVLRELEKMDAEEIASFE